MRVSYSSSLFDGNSTNSAVESDEDLSGVELATVEPDMNEPESADQDSEDSSEDESMVDRLNSTEWCGI